MAFFQSKNCYVCGKLCNTYDIYKLKDKTILCNSCLDNIKMDFKKPFKEVKAEDIDAILEGRKKAAMTRKKKEDDAWKLVRALNRTGGVTGILEIDSEQHKWVAPSTKRIPDVYKYSDIVKFELLEDGESVVSGGGGEAILGGLFFGEVGAIVGSNIGGKTSASICTGLSIDITLNDINNPSLQINLIKAPLPKKDPEYERLYRCARECMSLLQLMHDEAGKKPLSTSLSVADELLKFKQLLDLGALTEEEFESKKKQLLGM